MKTDEQLMQEICNGSSDAFTDLYNRYYSQIVHFHSHFIDQDSADEVAQKTMIAIYKYQHTFQHGRAVKPWIYTIASRLRNKAIKEKKRRSLNYEVSDLTLVAKNGETDSVVDEAIFNEERGILAASVETLAEPKRSVVKAFIAGYDCSRQSRMHKKRGSRATRYLLQDGIKGLRTMMG